MINKLPREKYYVDIALGIILSIVTCGIYNVLWNKKQMEAMNELLGREEYQFTRWLLLCLVTCGIYHIYYEYKMGSDLETILQQEGRPNNMLAILGLCLSCFGLTIVADAIYQQEINAMVTHA